MLQKKKKKKKKKKKNFTPSERVWCVIHWGRQKSLGKNEKPVKKKPVKPPKLENSMIVHCAIAKNARTRWTFKKKIIIITK